MNFAWLIAFSILTFAISILYFYMFSRRQEQFMRYWGFSWVAYSLSLFCLLVYFSNSNDIFLELRKVVDMFNLILLLYGTYSFMHIKIPTYWYRFSLYLLLLAAICMIYNFDLLSFYLPVSIFQIIITCFICYNVFYKWSIAQVERTAAAIVFLLWGIGKSTAFLAELFTETHYNYIMEILFSNIVNFCILTIYIVYTRKEEDLADNLYKTVVENAKDAIFYYKLRPYCSFEFISPAIEYLTGYAPAAFYNNPQHFRNLVTEKQVAEIDDIFTAKFPYIETHILELCKQSGEKFWGEFDCSLVEDENGETIAIEGTLRDVTRIKSAEMEQLNTTKSRNMLLSYISHELRTPITSIAGYLTALGDGTINSEEDKTEAMEIITSRTLTLKNLIDDLDQLTKLETHQFTFNFMSYTAGDVAEMLAANNIGYATAAGFDVKAEYDTHYLNQYWIAMDRDRINQVFSNLIINAIKYSRDDKRLLLKFSIDDTEENFIISVEDKGIGIKDKNLSQIFNRFYRADDNTGKLTSEGRGLGLSLCKEIMTAHQGDIYAESVYGQGSTFTFFIPLYYKGAE